MRLGAAALLCASALLAACQDGYPSDDAVLLDEREMGVPELLQTLDRVGARPHLRSRYRHALAPGCVLELRTGAPEEDGGTVLRVPLAGADITTRLSGGDTPAHEVLVYVQGQVRGESPPLVLHQNAYWVDWVQTRSLLQQLQRHCAAAAARSETPDEALRNPSGSDPG